MEDFLFLTEHEFFQDEDGEIREGYVMYQYEFTHKEDWHFLNIWLPVQEGCFLEWGHNITRFPNSVIKNKYLEKTPDWFQELYKKTKRNFFKIVN